MKKLLSILLAVVILSGSLLCMAPQASADSLYIRKIVSVVYDDSGSMRGDKWAYANYAMQAFCGMLNSEDQLYITYMSQTQQVVDYTPEKIDLSAGGIQGSINRIEKHNYSGSTPYAAVDMAYDKLKTVQDANPNTQYWLVVITDGEFDEFSYLSNSERQSELTDRFQKYAQGVMPNGTHPQITFLSIGNVAAPQEDQAKGIFTYAAQNAGQIIDAMSQMSDRISGRTRVSETDIQMIDGQTIQVSSSIPRLNIAMFIQGSDAKITKTAYAAGGDIPISRNAALRYNGYDGLVGGAYLVGDSQSIIDAGTYTITFDKAIAREDVVILFEPALEMRMKLMVNGNEVTDMSQLEDLMEGDRISVSCNIYEMGTDRQIDPNLLPPETKFEITIYENGKLATQSTGEELLLPDYILKQADTEITAKVHISGFNPIEYKVRFTPTEYVSRAVYTMDSTFGSNTKSVRLDDIASNTDMTVCFTVYADGVPITDANAVRALNPVITVSPQGNSGTISYSSDGKIVFTPTAAQVPAGSDSSFSVDVTCTLSNGVSDTETYTVLISKYEVIAVDAVEPILKNGFFGNQVAASFYITKDGVQLRREDVENGISVILNDAHAQKGIQVSVAPDGVISVTPGIDEEHILNFWSWWTNWKYYWGLTNEDVIITLNHNFGASQAKIDVVHASAKYRVLNVWAPAILELVIVLTILAYIIRYFTKARFAPNAVLYVGTVVRNRVIPGTQKMTLKEYRLNKYNKFKHLWNPFKELTVNVGGLEVTAIKSGRICCSTPSSWYSAAVVSKVDKRGRTPDDIVKYYQEKRTGLLIKEIRPESVMDEQNPILSQDDSTYYLVKARFDTAPVGPKKMKVINQAAIFCYTTI